MVKYLIFFLQLVCLVSAGVESDNHVRGGAYGRLNLRYNMISGVDLTYMEVYDGLIIAFTGVRSVTHSNGSNRQICAQSRTGTS